MNNHASVRIHILSAALILALVTSACGLIDKFAVTKIKTGPTQTIDLQVPMPAEPSTGVELNLEFLAGDLSLAPGTGEHLASGTATFNAAEFEPNLETNGSSFTLRQGKVEIEGIPTFDDDLKNVWDLQLADTPMSLNIHAGAYTGNVELGGLSLEKLVIDEVGSTFKGRFSTPNRVGMSSFNYDTGGSTIELTGLANANFEKMIFTSGAGDYTLSFDGELQRDANVTIESGASTVTIIVPDGANAQVTFDGGLTGVNAGTGWVQSDNVYTLQGSGPTITIAVKMGLGTLNLKTA
jgi:hypothetical protein